MTMVRRTLVISWGVLVMTLVGITLTVLVVGALVLIAVLLAGSILFVLAYLASTTVAWPNAEVVEMRSRLEQLMPPPPTASFVNATITTYYDGDRWRCVEYRTAATAQDTRTYYQRAKEAMLQGSGDTCGFDGPGLVPRIPMAKDATITVKPWDPGMFAAPGLFPGLSAFPQAGVFAGLPPSQHVSVCYSYEFWYWPETRNWPMRPRRPIMIAPWPDPSVVAERERVERAFPPDPSWTFTGATLTRHPDGWRQACVTYQTGVDADVARAHYQRAQRARSTAGAIDGPWLGKASVKATDGTVTLCPF